MRKYYNMNNRYRIEKEDKDILINEIDKEACHIEKYMYVYIYLYKRTRLTSILSLEK